MCFLIQPDDNARQLTQCFLQRHGYCGCLLRVCARLAQKYFFVIAVFFFFVTNGRNRKSQRQRAKQWYTGVDSIDKCSKDTAGFETTTIEALRRCERLFAIRTASLLIVKSSRVAGMTFERQGKRWDNILTRSQKWCRMQATQSALSIFFCCLAEPSEHTDQKPCQFCPLCTRSTL